MSSESNNDNSNNDMKTTDSVEEASAQPPPSPYICNTCRSYLDIKIREGDSQNAMSADSETVCSVCQNLWIPNPSSLKQSLEQACEIYGGMSANHFSTSSITISLPGALNLKYRKCQKTSSAAAKPKPKLFSTYLKDLKAFLAKEIEKLCNETCASLPPILSIEEQGFLMIHLQCVPPKSSEPPITDKKKKKRHRWCPHVTQGGDPRANLEEKLQQQGGYQWYSMADAEKLTVYDYQPPLQTKPMEYHFVVFRKPIYIYGYYTKSRRDVSQSPFTVMREAKKQDADANSQKDSSDATREDDSGEQQPPPNKKRKKVAETLGATSVEEQICNPIVEILGGISTQNNTSSPLLLLPSSSQGALLSASASASASSSSSSNVIYGMCKFHASGREDMDVRMLIRPNSKTLGRPFCVQLIDAKRALQSQEQLNEIVTTINYTTAATTTITPAMIDSDDSSKSALWHGQNPLGVGVCPEKLRLAPASAYSTLQSDTESKVKHYGCHCWSQRILPKGDEASNGKITASLFPEITLPFTIQQRTPLRVVHRRANLVRERQILQMAAWRVDDHHFRLELSTQAGTYIKEFVHGDLLRTQPSIASIMGCKSNLLLLDCEGIELNDSLESQT
ncbi:MAG: hypothetical protein SGBAC_004781 [Bacillariaceae sp.]